VIGVVGDFQPQNETHAATNSAFEALVGRAGFKWFGTDEVRSHRAEIARLQGLVIAPASPYRDMEAVIDVIRDARERGVPLVGT
jgi:CTP synthase (UTP-ammonia lyase)